MNAAWASSGNGNSLAAKAIAAMPPTSAPPSFDGHGWLFAVNLTIFTAGFYLFAMLAGWLWMERRRYQGQDGPREPVTVWRTIGICISVGFCLRCGAEAYNLWAWDPRAPAATGAAQQVKRFVDVVAFSIGARGMALFFLSGRSMTIQLRKNPREVIVRPTLPMLKKPLAIVILTFATSIAITALR